MINSTSKRQGEIERVYNPFLDSKGELDRHSIAYSPNLVVACVDNDSEEEDEMLLDNKKKGLRDLLKDRGRP